MNKAYTLAECEQRIKSRFPQIQIRTLTPILTGWDSYVVDVNGEYIFRFPLRQEIVPGMEKEIALLPALAKALTTRVPVFEFISETEPDDGHRFVGYHKIPGLPLSRETCASPRITGQISNFLNELHGFPISKAVQLGIPNYNASQWRQNYVEFYGWIRDQAYPLLDEPARSATSRLWEGYLSDERNFRIQTVLVHFDLAEEHILCDANRETVTGVIDWEDATIGDPALDLVGLLWVGGRDFVERVIASYQGQLGESVWERMHFYGWMSPFHEIRYGLSINDEARLQQGLANLSKNIAEWENKA